MTTSAVSFLSAVFSFGRQKGVGRAQPRVALFKSRVLAPVDSAPSFVSERKVSNAV